MAPTTLKKFVLHGSADKEEIREAIQQRWNKIIPQNDIADAYVLAQIGTCILNTKGLSNADRDTVKVVTRPVKASKRNPRRKNNKKLRS